MNSTAQKKRAICGICSAGCWVEVTYDGEGRIAAVEADGRSPYGMICRVGKLSPQIVYSKDRLLHPLRRKGPKGTFDFTPISWDEAYGEIVENLERVKEESGPEATAVYTGSGSFELAFCDIFQPRGVAVSSASSVLFPFGSPNTLGVGALCYVSFAMIAPHVTMGGMFINMFADIENAELIVIWGKNPASHCPPTDFKRIEEAHRRGAAIIVIDPRKTTLAGYPGAEWVPIRPGTDGALALGMCHVLIEEELYDEAFAGEWTVGFEEFARHVRHYRPEVVEEITGIPAATVRSLARRIASADGAAPVMYSGLEYSDGAVQAIRAAFVLWALAGQLDVPGGYCFNMRDSSFPVNRDGHVPNPDVRRAAGHNDFPVYTKYRGEFHAGVLPRSVLEGDPYRIRLLLSLGASIISSWPQSSLWKKTLAGLDFFVSIDRQLTADAAYADIVLPAATYYEIESYMVNGPLFRIRERIIEPVGEARADHLIMAELAQRLGYGHLYPQTAEELLRHALRGSGFSLEDVRAAGGSVQIPTVLMEHRKWEKGLLRPDAPAGLHRAGRRSPRAAGARPKISPRLQFGGTVKERPPRPAPDDRRIEEETPRADGASQRRGRRFPWNREGRPRANPHPPRIGGNVRRRHRRHRERGDRSKRHGRGAARSEGVAKRQCQRADRPAALRPDFGLSRLQGPPLRGGENRRRGGRPPRRDRDAAGRGEGS